MLVSNIAGTVTSASAGLRVIPKLIYNPTDVGLRLTWPDHYWLQSSTDVAGPYFDVAGANSPYVVTSMSDPQRYYRLRLQTDAAFDSMQFDTEGQFQFALRGAPGYNYQVLSSTNLVDWVPFKTNCAPFIFIDGNSTSCPARFYRLMFSP